jgi:hypothetical protein
MRRLGTVAYIVLVAFVVFVGVKSTFNAHDANRQAAAAISQNGVLVQQIKDQQHDQAERDAADAIERQQTLAFETNLLGKYSDLLGKYNHIVTSQRQLLRYLRSNGIPIPTRFVRAPRLAHASPSITSPPASSSGGTHKHPGHAAAPPAAAPAPAPAPTLPNGKPAPGNSGNAPGHHKH